MKRVFLALAFCVCGLWPAVSLAKPLLIQWPLYQATIPVERLILYRSVNNGPVTPYQVFWDVTTTAFTDTAVKWQRQYCYSLRAVTADDGMSAATSRVCARPNK